VSGSTVDSTVLDIDRAAVAAVVAEHPDGPTELRDVSVISVGASNRMYRLETDRGPLVLRVPPPTKVSKSAHDMVREGRVLRALERTAVPHARPLVVGTDDSPLGSQYLLMELVDGINLRWDGPRYEPGAVRDMALRTIDVLAEIGRVDWRAAGLEGFGRPEGFLERQVGRWTGQLAQYRSRELPGIDELAGWLETHRPAGAETGLMHGDFTFANVMLRPGGPDSPAVVTAVVDWEQATIGDPLVDLGWLVGLWAHADEEPAATAPGGHWVTQLPGMPTRTEIVERYALASGRDVSAIGYYQALALFKLAVVLEGNYAKVVRGESRHPHHRDFEWMVPQLIGTALDAAQGRR